MIPEELNRTMEFILASQARLAAAQEQERQDRLDFQKQSQEFQKESAERIRGHDRLIEELAQLGNRQLELLDLQSRRLDSAAKLHDDILRCMDDFQRQALHLLNLILDRLPPLRSPEAS